MNSVGRGILAFVIAVPAFYFTYWISGALLMMVGFESSWVIGSGALTLAIIAGVLSGRFIWRRSRLAGGLMTAIVTGSVVTGAVAFSIGFFGPMLFMPESNQGPLLGLLISGPLGFLLGGIGGGVYWVVRRPRVGSSSASKASA